MRLSHKTDETCPDCRRDDQVYVYEKEEGTGTKLQYSCDNCYAEWTEWK